MTKGKRVGAILGSGKGEVSFLGYGVYEADETPYGAVGALAEMLIYTKAKNPKIVLDSGKTVWGCECWWGPEGDVKKRLARWREDGYEIVGVDIEEIREAFLSPRSEHPADTGGAGLSKRVFCWFRSHDWNEWRKMNPIKSVSGLWRFMRWGRQCERKGCHAAEWSQRRPRP